VCTGVEEMRALKAITLVLATSALINHCNANASENCTGSGMSGVQVEECLKKSSSTIKQPTRKPATFPVYFAGLGTDVKQSGTILVDWGSNDGEHLEIITKDNICNFWECRMLAKSTLKIHKDQIISYEMSIVGTSTNASEQVQSVAMAAFIFPLAAPFAAAINARQNEEYLWTVRYIDENGIEQKETFRTSSSVPVADRYYTFLPTLIGRNPLQQRDESDLKPFLIKGSQNLETKIKRDEALLTEIDQKKAWCTIVKSDKLPLIYERYKSNIASLNKVRAKLKEKEYIALVSQSSDELWEEHLRANPNFAIWVKANPSAAAKVKSCPAAAA